VAALERGQRALPAIRAGTIEGDNRQWQDLLPGLL
jgi:hypothetical protein